MKILCSGVLMAGMDANRLKREDLALAQGLIKIQIDLHDGVVTLGLSLDLFEAKRFVKRVLGVVKQLPTPKSSNSQIRQEINP